MADELYEPDSALEEQPRDEDKLQEVHKRALARFDAVASATQDSRAKSLEARRFITIPGAQWEGAWGEQFDNSIKMEVDKVGRGVAKIENDYRENRIIPDFRPDGPNADQDTADTLDGLHRADSYRFKSQQARDNAFFEAVAGGFGAYRLTNEWEDEEDKDNDHQRVNPGSVIVDADQSVFFDLQARMYDKSDARYAFVRTKLTREVFQDEYEGCASDWPDVPQWKIKDWFQPDTVAIAEYYEREDVSDTVHILTYKLSGEEKRLWASDMEKGDLAAMKADGWTARSQRRQRCRIHKYILSGNEVLEDCGFIAGTCIPIVPVYGKRYYVDGIERWKGYVLDKMDSQRLYNSNVSKLAETNALAPREVPIFAPEQIDGVQAEQWARANIDRLPYLTAHPLLDPVTGGIAQTGPIGMVQPPTLAPVTATLLQIANQDLQEDQQDGAEQVKANTSAEAMDIAAARVDAKSGIYLDNMRQSVEREGEIYLSMATEIYSEAGRKVRTMSEDGDDGEAEIKGMLTNGKTGESRTINDLENARYKVIASVTETTATRRDKTVKAMLRIAEVSAGAQDMEMSQAALVTAVMNTDGEGTADFLKWVRKSKALPMGLVEPNEEEQAAMEAAAQEQTPDPMAELAAAQSEQFKADAAKKVAEVGKIEADTGLAKAKTIETLNGIGQPANDVGQATPVVPQPRALNKGPY
ncbi:portal protein [Novosphingobium sp. MMS21-SN21R]|uniref:portal protein n=1 Tax=Novosphingobium sp. MMS21-SN21R TaxID=2969298 RepID=UPI002886D8E9|nr:portal protein [Novosphingobium sp. MMS21-SN21R]MDT0507526.1 portal protein [Novosphingobium sp. MMS21-SN21R]